MQGITNEQRSNAVGNHTSYLPDADPGRFGGNTYTGDSAQPTLQDYENFFGPSARDIKTDLQRFKRHGRWHLPDILKGPNPWLTDRIDGLITDATNSPFTTKLLPYRYKEDVDGKIKWNVWSFDEGMASRVPYESAARTLTQSKRSFAGYMVRQGMAIVLEHNFMMTPKGRENFKNQLNQLIGSIQYTNDLDVHMALILAPSYQKTMRERYYSLDKAPNQICREFVDLFGMMQKNVNALDILIEEGKAILRTWGGPMPDFLLCNSKLTFQMTMTPEKTNYITQGSDGVKRLRQGPDLASYRGLSIIHSRSFAMETGQHPRDILRRRVRTAEYYRILPDKKNLTREFEFYNEERDTWFTLSFLDLLKYARYQHQPEHSNDGYGRDNPSKVDRVYHTLVNSSASRSIQHEDVRGTMAGALGDYAVLGAVAQTDALGADQVGMMTRIGRILDDFATPLRHFFVAGGIPIRGTSSYWTIYPFPFDLGIQHIPVSIPCTVWEEYQKVLSDHRVAIPCMQERTKNTLSIQGRLTPAMARDLYMSLSNIPLNHPFKLGEVAVPNSPAWFLAYAFYLEVYKRGGIPMDFFAQPPANPIMNARAANPASLATDLSQLVLRNPMPSPEKINLQNQFLSNLGTSGSVNHALFNSPPNPTSTARVDAAQAFSRRLILTYEMLGPLLREYIVDGKLMTGLDFIEHSHTLPELPAGMFDTLIRMVVAGGTLLNGTLRMGPSLVEILKILLGQLTPADPGLPDVRYLAQNGVATFPMGLTTISHFLHPQFHTDEVLRNEFLTLTETSYGHVSLSFLNAVQNLYFNATINPYLHHWTNQTIQRARFPLVNITRDVFLKNLMKEIRFRIFQEAIHVETYPAFNSPKVLAFLQNVPNAHRELAYLTTLDATLAARNDDQVLTSVSPANLGGVTIDLNRIFEDPPPVTVIPEARKSKQDLKQLEDVEIVVIRPNIEHNMLGIIMGLGGDTLGNTLWGQTELSVYDDSMHGIWGMSYKYHERAIVFNEKNLIRLWDIAYDGYNGGKDDTYVDWTNGETDNGYKTFQRLTLDVSKNYRGPSMMVMAFVHERGAKDASGEPIYEKHFRRNWPSPIVFHDSYTPGQVASDTGGETLPLDYDNLQVIDVKDFRVFNNDLYYASYKHYRDLMPKFHEMHTMRKSAGQASADSETHTDSLAFQGSMRIKEAGGGLAQEIHGSGHHGPDYTGVASVRAGKGQKMAGQAPTLHRLI